MTKRPGGELQERSLEMGVYVETLKSSWRVTVVVACDFQHSRQFDNKQKALEFANAAAVYRGLRVTEV